MNRIQIEDFFDSRKLGHAPERASNWKDGLLLRGHRRNAIGNLGTDKFQESAGLKFKRAFFVDWRAFDRLKASLISRIDFRLDTNSEVPKPVAGGSMRESFCPGFLPIGIT